MILSGLAACAALCVIPGTARAQIFETNDAGGINGTIGEYTTSGATVNAALVSGLPGTGGIAVSGGDLFVVRGGHGIGEYTTSGKTVNAHLVSGLNEPVGIVVVTASVPEASSTVTVMLGLTVMVGLKRVLRERG